MRFAVWLALVAGCSAPLSGSDAGPLTDAGQVDAGQPDAGPVQFVRIRLHSEFFCEGAAFGDFDKDGKNDAVSGPYWYRGPGFTERRELYPPKTFDVKSYSDCFFQFVRDFDDDGWPDVLVVGFPGQAAHWLKNPGAQDAGWSKHLVVSQVDNESPALLELVDGGTPELILGLQGQHGWAKPQAGAPFAPWSFHRVTPPTGVVPFTHGLGAGDVDGDGRADLLEAKGVWLQPADATLPWVRRAFDFGTGGAQMFTRDLDGDGDLDVITTLQAHGYGVAWFEQQTDAGFVRHEIDAGAKLHEPHALEVVDLDGDGLDDLLTGERFWAHVPPGNPSFDDPAKLVWLKQVRDATGTHFEEHVIDTAAGVGTQVLAGDLDLDGRPDVVVGSKKGAYVYLRK